MNCEHELDFLRDILKKCYIRSALFSPADSADAILDSWFSAIVGAHAEENETLQKTLGNVEDFTKYHFTNEFRFCYIFLRLPLETEKNLLFIGPFLPFALQSRELLEIGENLGLTPGMQKNLKEYYASLPVILENDRIFTAIDTFCEHIWKTPSFSITKLDKSRTVTTAPPPLNASEDPGDEMLANMEKMELRYAFENELIQAVTQGQQYKEKLLHSTFKSELFEARVQDPVRNAKNYCIILNTLLRKAAEQGGVHPWYIDRASSLLAAKIELVSHTNSIPDLMKEIFSTYCRLVKKQSTKQFSPVVKKTVLLIDSDLSGELSLHTLAEKQGVSAGYLSTAFKKETGKTVCAYIREKRIQQATHLLAATDLQIQTVAMHCGIMDVQYFSKLFKRQTGKTPNEYRKNLRQKS